MRLSCPTCGEPIPAEHIHLHNQLAKCGGCDAVFSFAKEIDTTSAAAAAARASRPRVAMPYGFNMREEDGRLIITQRWLSWWILLLVLITAMWHGFTWPMLIMPEEDVLGVAEFLLLTPFILVGLGLLYALLAWLVNTTTIQATAEELTIRQGPLPWAGNRRLDSTSITQLFCREHVYKFKDPGTSDTYTYEVHAILTSGERAKLITNLAEPEHALFIEQELERGLGIRDRRVTHELKR